MITRIRLLRNVGKFESVDTGASFAMDRLVLIYAENGRGKTTLSAILRSLATGDPIPIIERRRLASEHAPHIVLECTDTPSPLIFQDDRWNRTLAELAVFDDVFVDENVYSGLSVAPVQRQNLHEIVIGAQGVTLNRQLQTVIAQIEEHNSQIRMRAAAIPVTVRSTMTVDEFCAVVPPRDIEDQILVAERELAAAQEQNSIRTQPLPAPIELPMFNLAAVSRTLALDLAALDMASVRHVNEHFAQIGRGGEAWVADGMQRVARSADGGEVCPFCAQDLSHSELLGHYRAYFSQEYAGLRQTISRTLGELNAQHPVDTPARFERSVRVLGERLQYWSRFCEVPGMDLDTENITRSWQAARTGLVEAIQQKSNEPLVRSEVPEPTVRSVEEFDTLYQTIHAFNARLEQLNALISGIKRNAVGGDVGAAKLRLERLTATRNRGLPEVEHLCTEYMDAQRAKRVTEEVRDNARQRLDQFRADAFPSYQRALNHYLGRFGAGFGVQGISPADTRGGPTCNYELIINNVSVPVSGGLSAVGEVAFKNTLSSGDRNTLALSFFLSSLDSEPLTPNPDLARKIIVIDDPISSFDEHRIFSTVQEIRRLTGRARQLIVLSHNREFLCRIWQGIGRTPATALKLERDANGSTLLLWDVSNESLTEYDRNHALLRSYATGGSGQNSRAAAQALRPTIEGYLRVARSQHFTPTPRMLHTFLRQCRERIGGPDEILSDRDTLELEEIVPYADQFHHDTNPAWSTAAIRDAELDSFVRRVLDFTAR